jgi:hypothetical protein
MTHGPNPTGPRPHDAVPGLVSVIIPALNAARWIGETLASVRAQAHRPIETIVVDDGSTDATAHIAGASGARVIHTAGAGPGAARNAGMAAARGTFLQFLDADDLLAPGKIARQVRTLDESGADVAWEPFHRLEPAARAPDASSADDRFAVGARITPELGPDLAAALLTSRGFVQIGALLVRRSPRTDAVWFAGGRDTVEDVRYAMALALAGARWVCSDGTELGLLFRQHDGPRYSNRPLASFARACASNAIWAQDRWEHDGGLTPVRRAALCEAYAFAARQLADLDPVAFADVAARGAALGPEFLRRLPARVRWLSRLVGYRRAESIASGWRRVRRGEGAGGTDDAVGAEGR